MPGFFLYTSQIAQYYPISPKAIVFELKIPRSEAVIAFLLYFQTFIIYLLKGPIRNAYQHRSSYYSNSNQTRLRAENGLIQI